MGAGGLSPMKIFVALIFLVLMPWHAIAQTTAPMPSEQPMPLEQQEREDRLKASHDKINSFAVSVEQATGEKKRGCVRAIGAVTFCNCIIDTIPWVMDFPLYVATLAATKEDLHYDTMSEGDKTVIDTARQARDKCVNAAKPMVAAPANKSPAP